MKLTNSERWAKYFDGKTPPTVVTFAVRWATVMEERMASGRPLKEVAQQACRDSDLDGMSGFTVAFAVSMLAACWIHGEELRRWYNLHVAPGKEGKDANRKGVVLNPASGSFH